MTIAAILADKGSEVATIARRRDRRAMRSSMLGERRIGALPVVDGDRIAGIISERDVIYCLRDHGAEVLDWPVGRVMSSPAITVDPPTPSAGGAGADDPAADPPFAGASTAAGWSGIVSIGDLVKHRMERIEAEAEAMREYIQSA